jgi:hypothetical protein
MRATPSGRWAGIRAPTFGVSAGDQTVRSASRCLPRDWKLVRSEPNQFAVAPNHVAEDFEAVITTYPDFWLVEKFGEAGEIAEKLATPTEDRPNPSQ